MRWLSPPDSVPEARASVRYSSPTLRRNPSRSLISFRMRAAISWLAGVSVSETPANQSHAAAIDREAASLMLCPATLTASASGFSRAPWHTSQVREFWYRPSSSRTQALSVSRNRRSMFGKTPSNGRSVEYCFSPSS